MYVTGMVRKVDNMGRITIPSDIRVHYDINASDYLEVLMGPNFFSLKKYAPADIFNGYMEDLIIYHGKKVSRRSIIEMAEVAGIYLLDDVKDDIIH